MARLINYQIYALMEGELVACFIMNGLSPQKIYNLCTKEKHHSSCAKLLYIAL